MTAFASSSQRRFDLDWLRIIAFGLLIFYHMGMYFVTWDWHVKSLHAGPAIQPLMLLTSPWRLALLFLIAGIATRYMADKLPRGEMAGRRSWRLLLPLIFGMLVIVPPQTYYEVVEKLGFDGGWAGFYLKYVSFHDGWRVNNAPLIVPTWNHLWFVIYLWLYTMLVIAARPLLHGESARRIGLWLQRPLSGWGLILWPALWLIGLRLTLRPIFGQTHALVDDWYLHAAYFSLFLFGYGMAKAEAIWTLVDRLRWPALGLGIVAYAISAWFILTWPVSLPVEYRELRQALWAFDQWVWILALLGLARRFLTRDSAARRYLTDAVFPFYILHQTIIVVVGHHLRSLGLTAWEEAGVILIATFGGCLAGYEMIRRSRWARPLFGLQTVPRSAVIPAAARG